MPFNEAIAYNGPFEIHTKKRIHYFVKIGLEGEYLKGYRETAGKHPYYSIPINLVEEIRVRSNGKSFSVTYIPASIVVGFFVTVYIAARQWAEDYQ